MVIRSLFLFSVLTNPSSLILSSYSSLPSPWIIFLWNLSRLETLSDKWKKKVLAGWKSLAFVQTKKATLEISTSKQITNDFITISSMAAWLSFVLSTKQVQYDTKFFNWSSQRRLVWEKLYHKINHLGQVTQGLWKTDCSRILPDARKSEVWPAQQALLKHTFCTWGSARSPTSTKSAQFSACLDFHQQFDLQGGLLLKACHSIISVSMQSELPMGFMADRTLLECWTWA